MLFVTIGWLLSCPFLCVCVVAFVVVVAYPAVLTHHAVLSFPLVLYLSLTALGDDGVQVTMPLVDYYADRGVLKTFHGTQSDVIYPQVKKWLEEKHF